MTLWPWRKPKPVPTDTHWRITGVVQKGRTVTMTIERNNTTRTLEFYGAWGIYLDGLV